MSYPHKTGAFVQPVSSETKKNLDRLDRRAVKVGGKMSSSKAREWKDVVPQPKPQPKPQQKYFTITKLFLIVSIVVNV